MLRLLVVTALVLGVIVANPAARVQAQEPTLDEILSRVVRYVTAYQESLSGLVSEERYDQVWRRGRKIRDTRTLKSDVLLTRPTGGKRFLLLRDVFEVDGHQVRDRDERLLQLFLKPSASTSSQAMRILEEGARDNIGDVGRTINTPTLPWPSWIRGSASDSSGSAPSILSLKASAAARPRKTIGDSSVPTISWYWDTKKSGERVWSEPVRA